jgi:hypothetical protein
VNVTRDDATMLPLRELVGFRSGDKGDLVNVALFADDEEVYALLVREATVERVKAHFGAMVRGRVDRYEARNVLAVNFVLHGALGGGGTRTLRSDNLGKSMGGTLVRMPIPVPPKLVARRRARPDVTWARQILDDL